MSFPTTLPDYIEAEDLARIIKDKSKISGRDYLVVDVRGDDFENGNIPGCLNITSQELARNIQPFINKHKNVPQIIFHCTFSQVRGPRSASLYLEASVKTAGETQKIQVLRGGFEEWEEKYRDDPELVENHD
ncbi:hypothetical protein G9A89_004246 [Geosiphon pyriformis]|nr:hypothetical protein G9A89_004246 [Geosiphon pyriformis]